MPEFEKGDEVRIVEINDKSRWVYHKKELLDMKATFLRYGGPYDIKDNVAGFISCELIMLNGPYANRYAPLDYVKIEKVE